MNCDVIKGNATMVTYRGLTFELELKKISNLTLNIRIMHQDQTKEHARVTASDTCTYYSASVHVRVTASDTCTYYRAPYMPLLQPLIHVFIADFRDMPV